MNKHHINNIKNNRGTTLIEIMTALIILAATFLPILAAIGSSSLDTDVQNSTVYAQTTARNVLDTLLDDVPFNSLRAEPGKYSIPELVDYQNPSKTVDYKVDMFKKLIDDKGNITKAQGKRVDERGVEYTITIYVYPIPAADNKNDNKIIGNELYFTYLPRPKYESKYDSNNKSLWYTYKKGEAYIKVINGESIKPYSNKDECEVKPQIKNARELGAVKNNNSLCIMKKVILTITWTARDKKQRSLVLYTMKGNLDSEK